MQLNSTQSNGSNAAPQIMIPNAILDTQEAHRKMNYRTGFQKQVQWKQAAPNGNSMMTAHIDQLRQLCKDDAAFERLKGILVDTVSAGVGFVPHLRNFSSGGDAVQLSESLAGRVAFNQWLVHLIDEVLPDVVYLYDPQERRYLYANSAIVQFGYTPHDLIRRGVELATTILHPDERESVIAKHRERLLHIASLPLDDNLLFTPFFDVQCRISCADGTYRWVQDRRYVLERDALGRTRTILGYLHDVHSLKEAQTLLEYQTALEKVTASISRRFAKTSVREIDTAVEEALREFGEFTGADRCYIFLAPQHVITDSTIAINNITLDSVYNWTAPNVEPATIRALAPAQMRWAFNRLEQLRSLQIARIESLPVEAEPLRTALLTARTKSILAVPLHIEGRVIGVLGMSSVRDERVWTKEEVRAMRLIAETLVHAFERKYAEHALRSSEARFRTIFDRAPLAVSVLSPQGLILSCNDQMMRLLGYAEIDLVGKAFTEFIRPDDRDRNAELFYELLSGSVEAYTLEAQYVHKDGSPIWTSSTASLVRDSQGKPVFVIRMLENISERKAAEANMQHYTTLLSEHKAALERQSDMLLQLNGELMQKQHELEDLNRSKDKFFSIVSHDLRSPFSSLLGISKLLAEGASDLERNEIQELSAAMNAQAHNVFDFMENLLKWAQAHTGRMSFAPTVLPLKEIAGSVEMLLRENAHAKGILLDDAVEPEISVFVDENMIRSVVQNLVSNALKFTPAGGTVRITAAQSTSKPKFVEVSVADTGVGMSEDDANKLFRIDVVHTTKGTEDETGSGLGLILCRELVEKNGGTIWVESQLGAGTTFTFTLPLAKEM
jgi:PAS domain S-box-containing protein